MKQDLFWLSDAQWEALKPILPEKHRGPRRRNDRIVISGIIFVLRSRCAWRSCPSEYGAYMTIFNRFNRWKRRGIWDAVIAALSDDFETLGAGAAKSSTRQHPPLEAIEPRDVRPAGSDAVLSVKLKVALECVSFYAAGADDSGRRAKETLSALSARS
jgi:transposase